jgi:hypothetical protein
MMKIPIIQLLAIHV